MPLFLHIEAASFFLFTFRYSDPITTLTYILMKTFLLLFYPEIKIYFFVPNYMLLRYKISSYLSDLENKDQFVFIDCNFKIKNVLLFKKLKHDF